MALSLARAGYATPLGQGEQHTSSTSGAVVVAALLAMVKRHTRWGFRKYHYRRRKKRRLPERIKQPLAVPKQPNPCWSMGFMNNALTDGRGFRTLNVAEDWNR